MPFDVMRQDIDEVILIINHYIAKGAHSPQPAQSGCRAGGKPTRVRVNDATASGGWF